MSVLRQHAVLLDTAEAVVGPSIGPVHQLTPSDGDVTSDADQGFVAVVVAERIVDEGPSVVVTEAAAVSPVPGATKPTGPAIAILVEGSFDRVRWARVVAVSVPTSERRLDRVVPIGAVPPYLRARVYATNLATQFSWKAYVAVGSNAPFRSRVVA